MLAVIQLDAHKKTKKIYIEGDIMHVMLKRSHLKLTLLLYILLLMSLLGVSAHDKLWAADHLLRDATQLGESNYRLKISGFIQPQVTWHLAERLQNLQSKTYAQYNGQYIQPNQAQGHSWGFKIARARLMMRGSLPKSAQKVNYMLGLELGQSIYTRGQNIAITEISTTLSYIPGIRLRIGHFKLPTMEEIVQPIASHHEFIEFSQTLHTLLGESPIANGDYQGAHYNFRDQGIQAFNSFKLGSAFAISYATMVSMAHRPNPNASTSPDLTLRASLSWVRKGKVSALNRKDITIGAWYMQGKRLIKEVEVDRKREGAFLKIEQDSFWFLGEWVRGFNATETPNLLVQERAQLSKHAKANGIILQGGPRFKINAKYGIIGIKARVEKLTHQQGDIKDLKIFQSVTTGLEWNPIKRLRLQYEYQIRQMDMPHAKNDIAQMNQSLGSRMMLQVTLLF
jgi:hypothetical protein